MQGSPQSAPFGRIVFLDEIVAFLIPQTIPSFTARMPALDLMRESQDALAALYISKSASEVLSRGTEIGKLIRKSGGDRPLHISTLLESLETQCRNKKNDRHREAAVVAIGTSLREAGNGREYLFLPMTESLLDLCADKGKSVVANAKWSLEGIVEVAAPVGLVTAFFPRLIDYLQQPTKKTVCKMAALNILTLISKKNPIALATRLPEIIQTVTLQMHDPNVKVSIAAVAAMERIGQIVQNPDIRPHLVKLVDTMANPEHVANVVKDLSHVTFVAQVDSSALALMVPLLERALRERSQETLRRTVIVTENLVRLVADPNDAVVFFPSLLPGVTKVCESASLPELREVAQRTRDTMLAAQRGAHNSVPFNTLQISEAVADLCDTEDEALIDYMAGMLAFLIENEEWVMSLWKESTLPYTASMQSTEALFTQFAPISRQISHGGEEPLVSLDFSLAYGGMMLLSHTSLHLMRGHRYAILGRNGAGKSTLLRAIAEGRVEGFPTHIKTWFVEHKLQGADSTTTCLQYLHHADAEKALRELGFDSYQQSMPVAGLSGGWKMKLELARGMIEKADILLLDEPTNHLDVANVAWLTNYLMTSTGMTTLVVSHDSGFLDQVATDVVHYEKRKLVYYPGNLSSFVQIKPEAKNYYNLSSSDSEFSFPQPGILTGIKSNTKAIMRMDNVSYTYPGAGKVSLREVSVGISLSSRVAILGANGAGKSTLIKVLLGELIPQEGRVTKHPNLRVGYVAQHAFHHIEMHLEKTPNQYIQWRYANGEDREVLMKASRVFSDEEKKVMDQEINGRKVEALIGRQKFKKTFRYEVKWLNLHPKHNTFMPREELLELGFKKLVQQFDDWESSREGLGARELSPKAIRKHLEEIGLDGDIADHNEIRGLSGGQKVKVVIAAAMWQNVHVLILDEPTNYLDRDSLSALHKGLKSWNGGVICITHAKGFVEDLCSEQWSIVDGRVERKGAIGVDVKDDFNVENVRRRKKKVTKKQQKEKDVRARMRELDWLQSPKGTPKPKTFYSDDEDEE